MKFFFFLIIILKVDMVMICTYFIIALSLTLIFCLSLLFWVLKIASSLVFFLRIFFGSWMLETTLSLIFILRLSLLAWVLEITLSFIFPLSLFLWMLETSLLLTMIFCLSLFLELQNEEKNVYILRLSIRYFPILKNSITHLSNSCDSKTCFTSLQISFLSTRTVNLQSGE